MSKKILNARHGDAVLSDEEFAKAIDEYKMRKAEREKTDADDVEEVEVEETKKPMSIEEQVEEVKARRDRRDEAGDPKDTDEAMSVIAHQDEDLDVLFDIIDTLLAKQDFDAAEPEMEDEMVEEEEVKEDELDKLNKLKGDADDEEEVIDEEEEVAEGAEDEEIPEEEEIVEEEEIAEDAEDEPEDEEFVEEEEFEEDGCDKEERMDSAASRAIRNHMMMGRLGRQVGLKNLEYKDIKAAKKAIIKAVRPDMRLDGKSDAYINGAFDNAKKSIRARAKKGTSYQKRQMFNKDSRDVGIDKDSAAVARQRMIERLNNNNK